MIQPILSINTKAFCTLSPSSPQYSLQAQSLNIYKREREKKKEKKKRGKISINGFFHYFNVLYLVLIFVGFHGFVQGQLLTEKKPYPKDISTRARWQVSQNFQGVLKYALPLYSLACQLKSQNGYSCVVQGCFVELEAYFSF